MRKRVAGAGAAGLVDGNAGRRPKHRTPEEVREQVLMLRRGKYDGFNDQHFTEKLEEVERLRLSRETVRRILREAGLGSPRKRRPPKHRQRRERKAQAGQMILWDGSEHDWLEGRGPRLCLMGAIDDATGEFLPVAHFTVEESTVGHLRVLRDILREKLVQASTRGHANKVLNEYRQAHNNRFAVPALDAQPAWRRAPSDHTKLLDLCALAFLETRPQEPYRPHSWSRHRHAQNGTTRRTRPMRERTSSSNTFCRAITESSTVRNASPGLTAHDQAFNRPQSQ
jgi:transposase